MWLFEDPRAGGADVPRQRLPVQPVSFTKNDAGGIRARVIPQHMMAQGNVRIDSPQVTGNTRKLEVWFEDEPPSSAADRRGDNPRQGFFPQARARQPNGVERDRPPQFKVGGQLLRVQAVRGRNPEASDIRVEGLAQVSETRTPHPGEKPLLVQGDKIHVAQANTPDAKVTVVGKSAYVEARGFSLSGGKIELDRSTNHAWVEGPGRMTLPVKQDTSGRSLLQTPTMEIAWQGGMTFDGQTAVYDRSVVVRADHQTLGTPHMEVKLKRRIDFGDPKPAENENGQSLIDEFRCRDGLVMDSRSFDEHGQTSIEHMEAHDIVVNETTGAIQGHGPGMLTSVRLGSPSAVGKGPAKAVLPPPLQTPPAPRFSYIKVQFEGPISGNLQRNEVTFSEQVKSVYGPVLDWNQKLEGDDPDKLGPQGVLLNCDELTVRTTPGVAKPSSDAVELEASGNTLVEGADFTARAHRITYTKLKDLLVLEGDGQSDAELFHQSQPGGPQDTLPAHKIMYWPSTKAVIAEGVHPGGMQLGGTPPAANNSNNAGATPKSRRQSVIDALKKGNSGSPRKGAPQGGAQ